MFSEIFKFEMRSWLYSPMTYIFLIINFLLVFSAVSIEGITIGVPLDNINVNAPHAIISNMAIMSLLTILMSTAFFNNNGYLVENPCQTEPGTPNVSLSMAISFRPKTYFTGQPPAARRWGTHGKRGPPGRT